MIELIAIGTPADQDLAAIIDHVRRADSEKQRRWAQMAEPWVTLDEINAAPANPPLRH